MNDDIEPEYVLYTDGSIDSNPRGIGGYAAVLLKNRNLTGYVYGSEFNATNNTMELMAAIRGLEILVIPGHTIRVYSDSEYLTRGITEYVPNWIKNGQFSEHKANFYLWNKLLTLRKNSKIEFRWVRGHSGDLYNEFADELAGKAMRLTRETGKCFTRPVFG